MANKKRKRDYLKDLASGYKGMPMPAIPEYLKRAANTAPSLTGDSALYVPTGIKRSKSYRKERRQF